MSQTWDGGDTAFRPETWATIASILRPGGFLVAFGGCRTYHRLACAIEDGGFVIQDCLMWLYGTGFPKRRDALKPSYEPIVLAYRPGGPRTMQVDECRISTNGETFHAPQSDPANRQGVAMQATGSAERNQITQRESIERTQTLGRWPANVVHDGSDEVRAAFPDSAGQQSDITGNEPSHKRPFVRHGKRDPSESQMGPGTTSYSDNDRSAARFYYEAKADLDDRWHSRHPTVKPVDLISWLVKLVTPPGGLVLDPFAGSGTTGAAAVHTGRSAVLIEREAEYVADIHERLASLRGEATRPAPARRARRGDGGGLMDIVGEDE